MLSAAEVYSPLGGVEQADYTKRGGRYTSDFIWNTKWKDQVRDCRPQFSRQLHPICSAASRFPRKQPHSALRSLSLFLDQFLQLDLEISTKEAKKRAAEEEEEARAGGLSFSRVADLNRYVLASCLRNGISGTLLYCGVSALHDVC